MASNLVPGDTNGPQGWDVFVHDRVTGATERALFVIDPRGVIRWSYLSPVGVNPGAEGIISALESLQGK